MANCEWFMVSGRVVMVIGGTDGSACIPISNNLWEPASAGAGSDDIFPISAMEWWNNGKTLVTDSLNTEL